MSATIFLVYHDGERDLLAFLLRTMYEAPTIKSVYPYTGKLLYLIRRFAMSPVGIFQKRFCETEPLLRNHNYSAD